MKLVPVTVSSSSVQPLLRDPSDTIVRRRRPIDMGRVNGDARRTEVVRDVLR